MGNWNLSDQDAISIAKAIVDKAMRDFVTFQEGSFYHEDAKSFFLSDHFGGLTGLDGKAILRDLQAKYDKKHKKGKEQ